MIDRETKQLNYNYIAFEGIDASGKSTLIKGIKERIPFIHTVTQPTNSGYGLEARKMFTSDEPFDEVKLESLFLKDLRYLEEVHIRPLRTNHSLIISDRCFVSQFVYNEDTNYWNIWETFVKPDLVILVETTPEVIKQRILKRKTKDKKETTLDSIITSRIKKYRQVLDRLEIKYIVVDGNDTNNIETTLKHINKFIRREK